MSQILVTGEAKIRDIQGPVVANSGVITALDGAASQYVRGDGTLADFPTSSGGGSSVSYYLNSSVSQGTIGGVAYRELSKEPIIGAGTDIAISANGYVASYLTDANDPDVLSIPGGNFNCEFYFSVNNNTGNPFFYAELYKYDGTTFTLLGSSVGVPEYINQGTIIAPYYFAIPVPTSALALTDRLAIRIYVNVDGRTVTLHTENGNLCQVVTTLSKGMVSLNNLTDQSQFLTTGTSGTDFNIASSGDTHTFNLPVASATNTGKLSSTDWSTFNGKVPYTGATASLNLGSYDLIAYGIYGTFIEASVNGLASSPLVLRTGTTGFNAGTDAISLISSPTSAHTLAIISNIASPNVTKRANIGLDLLSATRTYTLPDASGTLALTSNLSSYVPYTGATADVNLGVNFLIANAAKFDGSGSFGGHIALKQNGTAAAYTGYATLSSIGVNKLNIYYGEAAAYATELDNSLLTQSRLYKFPDLSGTLALLEGAQTFTGTKTFNISPISEGGYSFKILPSGTIFQNGYSVLSSVTGSVSITQAISAGNLKVFTFDFSSWATNTSYTYTLPAASGTIALTSNLSAYVPYSGATSDVNLGVYSITSNLQTNRGVVVNDSSGTANALNLKTATSGQSISGAGYVSLVSSTVNYLSIFFGNSTVVADFNASILSARRTYTLPDANGTIALTSNLSGYLPLTGGTLTGALSGTSATFSGDISSTGGSLTIGTGGNYVAGSIYSDSGWGMLFRAKQASPTNAQFRWSNSADSEFMRISPSGGLLVGTTPDGGFKLDIGGTSRFSGAATFSSSVTAVQGIFRNSGVPAIQAIRDLNVVVSGTAGQGIEFGALNGTTPTAGAAIYGTLDNPATTGDLVFQTRTASSLTTKMYITSGGNVGIGTSSPSRRLVVNSGIEGISAGISGATYGIRFDNGGTFSSGMSTIHGVDASLTGSYQPIMINGSDVRFGTSATERMRITSGGNVGIGTSAPVRKMDIVATGEQLRLAYDSAGSTYTDFRNDSAGGLLINTSGSYIINYIAGSAKTRINSNGEFIVYTLGTGIVYSNGGILTSTNPSDSRLKDNINDISWGLSDILKLRPVSYNWKDDKINQGVQFGFIAQEVQDVMPEAIKEFGDDVKYLGLEKDAIYATLVKAIQELKAEIDELKNK